MAHISVDLNSGAGGTIVAFAGAPTLGTLNNVTAFPAGVTTVEIGAPVIDGLIVPFGASVTGLRGVAAAVVSGLVVQSGAVDVTTALLLCVVPAGYGVALYCGAPMPSVAWARRLLGRDGERAAAPASATAVGVAGGMEPETAGS